MKEEFIKGIQVLKNIEVPCNWEDFCNKAIEILPGYVFIGQLEYHNEAHYGFYQFPVYAYEDEFQIELIGEESFQVWINENADGSRTITNLR